MPGVLRVTIRVVVILLLLVAAVVHGAGANEYPGITRPAVRFMTMEVLPLLAVAVLNLVAFGSDGHGHGPVWRGLALASSAALLASSLPHLALDAPPVFMALPVLTAFLLGLGIATTVLERRRAR